MAAQEEQGAHGSMLVFFGEELQRLREKHGHSQQALADATHTSRTLVNKIERAKRVPSKDFARRADVFLDTEDQAYLSRLWPMAIKYAYPSWFRPYVELEQAANEIRAYDTMILPGLLQTRAYARATLGAGRTNGVDDLLDARMERQTILERESPPELWVVVEENAVRRKVGDAVVMREQLQKVLDVSERTNVVFQVVPFEAGAHAGVDGAFHALDFAEGNPVVYVDGFLQGQLMADRDNVKAARRAYDLLMGAALSVPASASLIAEMLKEYT